MDLQEIKQLSIRDYLEQRGFVFKDKYTHAFCKSPFSRDTNWSLCYYPNTNSFYDWSTGFGGSIIDLVMAMDSCSFNDAVASIMAGDYKVYQPNYKATRKAVNKTFDYTQYLSHDYNNNRSIRLYALSRGIQNGYELCEYPVIVDNVWYRVPAMGFLHRDEEGKITGIKFRRINEKDPIDKENNQRYSSRGKMGFYTLENIEKENFGSPTLYVVEGEINAISLWQYCKETHRNAVVISFGGVSQLPSRLPPKYDYIEDRKLFIDFDGNDELFSQRICCYDKYRLLPVKVRLDKGEDINTLYNQSKIYLIDHLL